MAPGPPSLAELFSDRLGSLKGSRASATLANRPAAILVDWPQHVARLQLADRFVVAFNRDHTLARKRRTVLFYSRDLPIDDSVPAGSLLRLGKAEEENSDRTEWRF